MYMSLGGHNQDLNQKKAATIVLVALVLSMTFIVFSPTLAQTNDSQRQKAETLLAILSNDNTTIVEAFSSLDAQNITVPRTAETAYSEGVEHAEEAFRLMSEEKFGEASIEAVEAMKKFEETLRILESALPVEPTETEVIAEDVISLKANITRAAEYAERLENLTAQARARGYNTTAIERTLSMVQQHLRNATRELRALNLDGATEELLNAKTLLEELKAPFDRLTNLVKTANIENYLEDAEGRISETKENITQSTTLTAAAKDDAIAALNNSEASLANARASMGNNNVDEAIEDLEEAKNWEEESKRAVTSVTATPNAVSATDKIPTKADITASR
jgi:tetratricopeptide (TPR) repeat protein